jgi:hypothetical protein
MNKLTLQRIPWRFAISTFFSVCFLSIVTNAAIIRSSTESINMQHSTDGGTNTLTSSMRRAGTNGFKHEIVNGGKRAEFEDARVSLGGTYWYGWSFYHPSSPGVASGGWTIINQWFIGNRPSTDWPCGGAGHKLGVENQGAGYKLKFDMQYSTSGGSAITCTKYDLATFDEIKDKWVDVVMQAKWTANTDGFIKLWIRIGGDSGTWVQKINYTGRSQADGSYGPYFKWGAYTETIANGPRVVYTDEYRLGDSNSNFNEVAPGTTAPSTTVIDDTCSSLSNYTVALGGTWASTNGQCALTNAASVSTGIGNLLLHNTSVPSGDFTLTANGSAPATSNTWDDFAIIFNYQNSTNYYYAHFSESNSTTANGLFRVLNGTHTQIADFTATTTAGTTLHSIKVEKIGSTIKVYKGTTLMGQATDSNFTGGKVGFGTTNNNANFDNLKVTQ